MKKFNLLITLILTGLLSGCLATGEPTPQDKQSLKEKSAKFFDTSVENITISGVQTGLVTSAFHATFQGTKYNCYKHNLYGFIDCKKVGY